MFPLKIGYPFFQPSMEICPSVSIVEPLEDWQGPHALLSYYVHEKGITHTWTVVSYKWWWPMSLIGLEMKEKQKEVTPGEATYSFLTCFRAPTAAVPELLHDPLLPCLCFRNGSKCLWSQLPLHWQQPAVLSVLLECLSAYRKGWQDTLLVLQWNTAWHCF